VVRIMGVDGARDCPVIDIPAGPGRTTLAKGDIVTSIFLPARPARSGDAYLRFTPRSEMDIAVVSAAVSLTLGADGAVTAARVALGAICKIFLKEFNLILFQQSYISFIFFYLLFPISWISRNFF